MKNGKSGQLEIRPNLRHYQSIRVSLSAPRIRPFPRTLKTITAPQCLVTTRKAAQKVNIDIKSTLSIDFENNKAHRWPISILSTDFENNNSTSMPHNNKKSCKHITLASSQHHPRTLKTLTAISYNNKKCCTKS